MVKIKDLPKIDRIKNIQYSSIKSFAEKVKKEKIFPWLYKDSNKVKGIIISPDTDGFISALLLNEIFSWKVVGFYDGKILTTIDETDFQKNKEDYIFIDVEILRPDIKSVGHHILMYDVNNPHPLISKTENVCIQPNNWRGMDFKNTFATKYPFGTFHLLISIIYYLDPQNPALKFNPTKAIIPSIYLDGVFKNLFNYPENCLDWLKYMTNDDLTHPLEILLNHPTTPKDLMNLMKRFFGTITAIWASQGKRGKGKIRLDKDISNQSLNNKVAQELTQYLNYLTQQYGYRFKSSLWPVIDNKMIVVKFNKKIAATTQTGYGKTLNKKPLSFAITSKARDGLECTFDSRKFFD